jgi:hypothetical protein
MGSEVTGVFECELSSLHGASIAGIRTASKQRRLAESLVGLNGNRMGRLAQR